MRNQGVFGGEQDGGPGAGGGDDADGVAGVALRAAVAGPFETPVDGAEEGDDLRIHSISDGALVEHLCIRTTAP